MIPTLRYVRRTCSSNLRSAPIIAVKIPNDSKIINAIVLALRPILFIKFWEKEHD